MRPFPTSLLLCLLVCAISTVGSTPVENLASVSTYSAPQCTAISTAAYVPDRVGCPSHDLVRPANGISEAESIWVAKRQPRANEALKKWLKKIDKLFYTDYELPRISLAISGGGFRSLMVGAGVTQAMDERDSNSSMAGLWQAMVYQTGISGGGWFVGSAARNDWRTMSSMLNDMWRRQINYGLRYPNGNNSQSKATLDLVRAEAQAKKEAGFEVTLVDIYGRLLGYSLLEQPQGGLLSTMSQIRDSEFYKTHSGPFPIILSADATKYGNTCPASTIFNNLFEFSPLEWGSWDHGVSAFLDMHYLGSRLVNGKWKCYKGYDRVDYLTASSGDALGLGDCPTINKAYKAGKLTDPEIEKLTPGGFNNRTLEAVYPNPFFGRKESPALAGYEDVFMVDGGLTNNAEQVWPLLYRNVDVLFLTDALISQQIVNGVDIATGPHSGQLYNTYLRAKAYGLWNMPPIPEENTFYSKGFQKSNTVFGCDNLETMTIIYMPNNNYTTNAQIPSIDLGGYSIETIDAVVANGNQVALNNGTKNWPKCVACVLMMKTNTTLPGYCEGCFDEYCAKW